MTMDGMGKEFALGSWMNARRRAEGWSYADVAKRARSHGHKVSASNVERTEKVRPAMMKLEQVEWIVDVFGAPPRHVVQMFLQDMGYGSATSEPTTVEDAVSADPNLTLRDKELLGALLRVMRGADRGEQSWSGQPYPEDPEAAQPPDDGPTVTALSVTADLPDADVPQSPTTPNRRSRQARPG